MDIKKVNTEVTVVQPASLTMLESAINNGMDPEKLLQFYQIHEKFEANEARKAYAVALTEFKANPPVITKDKIVTYNGISYSHASLANVVDSIASGLAKHNLCHRWNTEQLDGGRIKVTCIITHAMGHSEEVSLMNNPDNSGSKNNIQAVGSTITYLERYTLLAATGTAAKDTDDDGIKTQTYAEVVTQAIQRLAPSIKAICDGIATNDLEKAVEARMELTNDDMASINISPTKARSLGIEPPFTTKEISIFKSDEWSNAVRKYSIGR